MAAWDRQQDEGDKAFEAFALYRDLGPRRSVRSVAQKLGKSATQIGRWSSKHHWTSRVTVWDFEQDRIHQRKHQETIEEVRARQASVLRTHIEAIGSAAAAASSRLASHTKAIEAMDPEELVNLMAKLARPLAMLLEAERELHGLRPPAEAPQEPPMTRAQAEAYLLGAGFDDGLNRADDPLIKPT
jgi:hypothetical protein